jgi:division protein CdvB (Snf7/Vps24/ESCRT-III family)
VISGIVLAQLGPLKLLGFKRDGNYKAKISLALKQIEFHLKELDNLKSRLTERRQRLFDVTVRALQDNNKARATVYANEHTELRRVIKVVETSELALMQVTLRLQSITDIGDVMVHINSAFKIMKQVSRTVQGLVPALDNASQEINSTLTETMAEIGQLSPSLSVGITDSSEELIEQARKYAEEQADELKRDIQLSPTNFEEHIESVSEKTPLLATEDGREDNSILGVIYSSPKAAKVDEEIFRYAVSREGAVDVSQASTALGIPPDEVEHSVLKLLAEGKVRLVKAGEKSE